VISEGCGLNRDGVTRYTVMVISTFSGNTVCPKGIVD